MKSVAKRSNSDNLAKQLQIKNTFKNFNYKKIKFCVTILFNITNFAQKFELRVLMKCYIDSDISEILK